MTQDYSQLASKIAKSLTQLRQDIPDAMNAFALLAEHATQAGRLDKKTKELIALAIAINQHCQDCITFHMQKLLALDVSYDELLEVTAMCIYMGGGPALMFANDALIAFKQLSQPNT